MKAIYQNNEAINYQQKRMNTQEDNNRILYNEKNIENIQSQYYESKKQAYYNDTINTAKIHMIQANMRIDDPRIARTNVPTDTDTDADVGAGTYRYIGKNNNAGACRETYSDIRTATPITTQETLSTYMSTNENLHSSHQYIDTYNQNMIHSKETVKSVCFENMNRIHERHNYNINQQLTENIPQQHNYHYDNTPCEYLNPTKEKTYLDKSTEQQINAYPNLTNKENHMILTEPQQSITENVQQSLPDAYKNNIHLTSIQTTPSDYQKNMIQDLQNQKEQQLEAIVDMQNKHRETDKEEETEEDEEDEEENKKDKEPENDEIVEQIYYNNSHGPMEYSLQTNEGHCDFSQHTPKEQNDYDARVFHENMNYQLDINQQHLEALYKQYTEQNKEEALSMCELHTNKHQEYLNKQNYFQGNNGNGLNSSHNLKLHADDYQNSKESHDQLEQFAQYMQSSTSNKSYKHSSATVMNTEEKIHTREATNDNETIRMERNAEILGGVMKSRTVNVKAECLNVAHSMLQQQQHQDVKEYSQYNINSKSKDVTNSIDQYIIQNTGYYNHIPIQSNISTNRQLLLNNANSLSMNSAGDMQSRLNAMNNMSRMNYNSLMFQHDKHANQIQTQEVLSDKDYIGIHMNEPYSKKDIKEFMLEPKLYTKMNIDMPELIDGLTTVHGEGGENAVKKESIMKYKDTWRLIPGKSSYINENGNTNQRENEMQLFQQYLDMSNQKTQQMLLNSSFNSLTGRLAVHPIVNDHELDGASKTYNYKDPAASFSTTYFQPTNSLAQNKTPPNTLYLAAINEANNGQEWKLNGTKQFISTNELHNLPGMNNVKLLNKLTGADKLNAINNLDAMPINITSDSHFPVDITEDNNSLLNTTVDMSREKPHHPRLRKRTLKKPTLPLCGNNMLTYDVKEYIVQTMKNYFKGKQTN